jgi:aminoglycoside phosphotransferase (APT) family kinase protein
VPIPAMRDLDVARQTISSWLADHRPEWQQLELGELQMPGGTGFSNETLIFDASWTADGQQRSQGLVLRVEPTTYRVFLEADFENQFRVIRALGESGGVKVAPMIGFEPDPAVLGAPFFIMGKVLGVAPADAPPYNQEGFLVEMTPEQRERLWLSAVDQLAAIHRVDYRQLGFEFLSKPARGATGLEQQVAYYDEAFAWAADGKPQPVAEQAWSWLQAHVPADRPTELSWGDSRIGNMLFHDGECRAVLDWEMVSLGGREMDLGWWLFLDRFHTDGYGLARLPGMGSRDDTILEWQSRTGLKAADLEFYEVFAGFRFAVVMIRLAQMAEEWGLPVPPDMETNNPVTHVLAHLLDIAPPGEPVAY